jgi:hypothetical protein
VSDLSAPGQDADGIRIDGASDGSRTTAVWSRSDGATTTVQAALGLAAGPGSPSPPPASTDVGAGAAPTGTDAVALQQQRPVRSLGLPTRVARTGTTRLVRLPVTTNAGQDARVRATCSVRPKRGSTADPAKDVTRACRVIRTTSAVRVRVSGRRALLVTVRLRAPEAPGFTAYSSVTTYRVRPVR